MPSGNGDHEKSGDRVPCSSPAGPVFADTLHELANAVTVLLVNTQVLEWKLPPYSRSKRPVREIERHAQRGGALLKRLLHQFEATKDTDLLELCRRVAFLHSPLLGSVAAVTDRGPATAAAEAANPLSLPLPSALGSRSPCERGLTSLCDLCTSASFPKEE